jgi:hypothetical protein
LAVDPEEFDLSGAGAVNLAFTDEVRDWSKRLFDAGVKTEQKRDYDGRRHYEAGNFGRDQQSSVSNRRGLRPLVIAKKTYRKLASRLKRVLCARYTKVLQHHKAPLANRGRGTSVLCAFRGNLISRLPNFRLAVSVRNSAEANMGARMQSGRLK